MIGTASPAGGNFDEPVTQSTLGTVKTFLGLSSTRAYKRFYPAVDPLISWSCYLDQLRPYFDEHLQPGWTDAVRELAQLLHQGDGVYQMMQVTGEGRLCDLSEVAFPRPRLPPTGCPRQSGCVGAPGAPERGSCLVRRIVQRDCPFVTKEEAHRFFTHFTNLSKSLNYTSRNAPKYSEYLAQIDKLVNTVATLAPRTLIRSGARLPTLAPPVHRGASARRQHRRRRGPEHPRVTAISGD